MASQLARHSRVDRAYFTEPAADHREGDTQPLDRQLRRIYSARPVLDWLLIVNRRHLEAVMAEYVEHYNAYRPHRSLELRPPRGPTMIPAATGGEVVRRTRLHGLINEYSRQAA